MRIYSNQTVFDAALDRIRWLYDQSDNICVAISGGKDSTIVYNLCMIVAKEKGRLPLDVMFLDQEAEWQHAIDHVRSIMVRDDVRPHWYQIPFKIFNATSSDESWFRAWEPEAEWIREKESFSKVDNVYGSDRFAELFGHIMLEDFGPESICICGMRGEESPARLSGITTAVTLNGETWGKKRNLKGGTVYDMYPIYDWSYTDVWKAIHSNGWPYCKIYDYQYQYGIGLNDMRISALIHETAVRSLFYLQEVEKDTWERLTKRLKGVSTFGNGKQDMAVVRELPPMFASWVEYRDYLVENIIDEKHREVFRKEFKANDDRYWDIPEAYKPKIWKEEINSLMVNDVYLTKLSNMRSRDIVLSVHRKLKQGKYVASKTLRDYYAEIDRLDKKAS